MKRSAAVLTAVILILCSVSAVFAAEPAQPVINAEMPDCYLNTGEEMTLWCDASSPDGGTLSYQWYVSDTPNMPDIRAIDGANDSTYFFSREQSYIAYYCCGVWNEVGGVKSQPVYTRLIRCEFFVPGPLSPVIDSEMPDCYMPIGEEITLWCSAISQDGGTLSYQWYASDTPDMPDIRAIDGANDSTYFFSREQVYTAYYCCGIWNEVGGVKSQPVYTRLIRCEFYDPNPNPSGGGSETVIGIAVSAMPDKTKYKVGEQLDLKGLKVKISTSSGAKELDDNSKLSVSGFDSSKAGIQSVMISYEGKVTSFTVEVAEENAQPPKNETSNQTPVNTVPNTNNVQNSTSNTNAAPQPSQNQQSSINVNTLVIVLIALVGVLIGVILVLLFTRKKK